MTTIDPLGQVCLLDAALATLQIANTSSKQNKKIIVVSEKQPYCGSQQTPGAYQLSCLEEIPAANTQSLPIDVFWIYDDGGIFQGFWEDLAAVNMGAFHLIYP